LGAAEAEERPMTDQETVGVFDQILQSVFQKMHLLRKAAARSAETICVAIGEILRAFTPTNAPTIPETQAMPNPKTL
jgi:hypothetical protein